MTYAVVMAAFDLDLPPRGVFAASAIIATMFNARILGIAAGECTLSPYYAEGPVADKFVEASEAELRSQLKLLEEQFRKLHASAPHTVGWRSAERLPDGFMISAARAADLIVVGRPHDSANLMRGPDVGNLMMQTGRPVLVVPSDVDELSFERVLIAWKNTRESRRAVSDAVPLLRKAKDVHILTIHEPEADDATTLSGADDVAGWLAQHGVKATAIARPDYGNVGKSIEQFAEEAGVDMIVAGAFGHSRFMEWLLGGVTRHLLRASKRSVLFSH